MPSILVGNVLESLKLPSSHLALRLESISDICLKLRCSRSLIERVHHEIKVVDVRNDERRTQTTGSQIPDFPAVDNVIQRSHNFLLGNILGHPMNLQHVDISTQPLHTCFNRIKDMLPTQALSIDPGTIIDARCRNVILNPVIRDAKVTFAQDGQTVSGNVVFLHSFGDDLFRLTM